DYVDWRDMVPDQTQVALTNYNPLFVLARRAIDNKNRPRMPYAFCSDEWVEGGISSCYQHDNGADIFEEMMFHDRLYEDRHIFDMHQGSAGMGDDVSYGGRPIENQFVSANGYYLVNSAGSYYDKTYAIRSILAQGIPSANWTRAEGVDSRWLISNLTNLYPDG